MRILRTHAELEYAQTADDASRAGVTGWSESRARVAYAELQEAAHDDSEYGHNDMGGPDIVALSKTGDRVTRERLAAWRSERMMTRDRTKSMGRTEWMANATAVARHAVELTNTARQIHPALIKWFVDIYKLRHQANVSPLHNTSGIFPEASYACPVQWPGDITELGLHAARNGRPWAGETMAIADYPSPEFDLLVTSAIATSSAGYHCIIAAVRGAQTARSGLNELMRSANAMQVAHFGSGESIVIGPIGPPPPHEAKAEPPAQDGRISATSNWEWGIQGGVLRPPMYWDMSALPRHKNINSLNAVDFYFFAGSNEARVAPFAAAADIDELALLLRAVSGPFINERDYENGMSRSLFIQNDKGGNNTESLYVPRRPSITVARAALPMTQIEAMLGPEVTGTANGIYHEHQPRPGMVLLGTKDAAIKLQADVGMAKSFAKIVAFRQAASWSSIEREHERAMAIIFAGVGTPIPGSQAALNPLRRCGAKDQEGDWACGNVVTKLFKTGMQAGGVCFLCAAVNKQRSEPACAQPHQAGRHAGQRTIRHVRTPPWRSTARRTY